MNILIIFFPCDHYLVEVGGLRVPMVSKAISAGALSPGRTMPDRRRGRTLNKRDYWLWYAGFQ